MYFFTPELKIIIFNTINKNNQITIPKNPKRRLLMLAVPMAISIGKLTRYLKGEKSAIFSRKLGISIGGISTPLNICAIIEYVASNPKECLIHKADNQMLNCIK